MYDPFMGTGSMAYVCPWDNIVQRMKAYFQVGQQPIAYFGALVFGSDIDGRQMRGKGMKIHLFSKFPQLNWSL